MTDEAAKLPCDPEAEKQVIGSACLEPERVIYAAAKHGITPGNFYVPQHSAAWEIILQHFIKQEFIDTIALDRAVPGLNVTKIIDATAAAAHAEFYIERVKDFWQRRNIVKAMRTAAGKLVDVNYNTADVMNEYESEAGSTLSIPDMQIRQIGEYREAKLDQWTRAQKIGYVGVPCHIAEITAALGGWRHGCLSIFGGYRGTGKSTFLRSDAKFNAKAGRPVALFSLEDPGDIAAASMACDEADVDSLDLDTGLAIPIVMEKADAAWKRIGALPLYLVAERSTIQNIIAASTMLKMRHKIEAVYIDHIQYIVPLLLPHKSRNDTIATYSSELCNMAKRLNVAVICASQLNRSSEHENRKPRLSDLRDCVTPNTQIECADGRHSIEFIFKKKTPTQIKSFNGNGSFFITPEVIKTGKKECLRIKTKSGKILELSKSTPLFDGRNWIEAKNLHIGSKICVDASAS